MAKKIEQPAQLTSISTMLVTLAAFLVSIIGLRYIGTDLIAPVLMAVFLSLFMLPIFRKFRNRGHSSSVSLFMMIILFVFVVGGLVIFVTWSLSLLKESMSAYTSGLEIAVQGTIENQDLEDSVTGYISPEVLGSFFSSIFGNIGSIILYLIVIPILSMLMLLQIDSFSNSSKGVGLLKGQELDRFRKFANSITIYAFGRLKVNTITGLLFFIALVFLDVDFAAVWGILTIFLSFIPYIGIVIAGAAPTLIALSTQGIATAVMVVVSVVIINLVAENVVDPHIQGKGNKLSTPTVIVALIFWSWMLGALGAIMAVPLTVLVKTILSDYKETAWMATVMEGNYSVPDPEAKSAINKTTSFLKGLVPGKNTKQPSN